MSLLSFMTILAHLALSAADDSEPMSLGDARRWLIWIGISECISEVPRLKSEGHTAAGMSMNRYVLVITNGPQEAKCQPKKQDWRKSREVVDTDQVVSQEESTAEAAKTAAEAAKPKYIPVPDPNSGINTVCPICQDKFENKWLDTAQEWVWLDAVLVGNRAYHASCHAEATRDREGTPRRTPEPVLGKRKAEVGLSSPKVRSLKTSA
jgi:hypothetical protein